MIRNNNNERFVLAETYTRNMKVMLTIFQVNIITLKVISDNYHKNYLSGHSYMNSPTKL